MSFFKCVASVFDGCPFVSARVYACVGVCVCVPFLSCMCAHACAHGSTCVQLFANAPILLCHFLGAWLLPLMPSFHVCVCDVCVLCVYVVYVVYVCGECV